MWKPNKQVEAKYQSSLQNLADLIFNAITGLQSVEEINIKLQEIANMPEFKLVANNMATRFITMANDVNARTWREAASQSGQGKTIFNALRHVLNDTNVGIVTKQHIVENANLIRTLPLNVSKDVTKFVASQAYRGLRSSEIAEVLQVKVQGYARARAKLIARTETSKAMTALTSARSMDLGVDWYIWKTANDGNRVRSSHKIMQNVICRFNDPPAPEELDGEKSAGHYNAGEIYNCRCYARPLIDPRNIQWPAKVYYNGTIQMMTLSQFRRISGAFK